MNTPETESETISSLITNKEQQNKEKVPKVGLIDSGKKIINLPVKTFIRNVNNSRRQHS